MSASQRQELLALRIESTRLKMEAQRAKLAKAQPQPAPQHPSSIEIGFVQQTIAPAPQSAPIATAA